MYSPTARLLAVLALLQAHHRITGAEIAERLAVDVRTVRRYITSLQDMGVPVEGERGPHGAYVLGQGTKMPPLMFTNEEAVALALGLRVMREYQFPVNVTAVESALAKTERVLPAEPLRQVRALQTSIIFNIGGYASNVPPLLDDSALVVLSMAAHERHRVRLVYRSFGDDLSERTFDPYGVVYNEGYWYTIGHCHLREDLRTFRLDRVQSVAARDETFADPGEFDLLGYLLGNIATVLDAHQVEVLLRTTMDKAQAMMPSYLGTLETCADGVVLRRPATDLKWVAMSLLALDFPVEIRKPTELQTILARIADKANAIAGTQSS